jgi:hypothetical protein
MDNFSYIQQEMIAHDHVYWMPKHIGCGLVFLFQNYYNVNTYSFFSLKGEHKLYKGTIFKGK